MIASCPAQFGVNSSWWVHHLKYTATCSWKLHSTGAYKMCVKTRL